MRWKRRARGGLLYALDDQDVCGRGVVSSRWHGGDLVPTWLCKCGDPVYVNVIELRDQVKYGKRTQVQSFEAADKEQEEGQARKEEARHCRRDVCNKIDTTKPKITTWGGSWQGRCKRAVCQRRFQEIHFHGCGEHRITPRLIKVVDVFGPLV